MGGVEEVGGRGGRNPVVSLWGHLKAVGTGLKYLIAVPRMTVKYPDEVIELPDGYRGMLIYHQDLCISCGLCATICPANAIKMYLPSGGGGGEGGGEKPETPPKRHPGIDYARCIFCGFCVDICPTGALEHSKVHDAAYERVEDMLYRPEEFAAGPPTVEFERPPKRLRPVMDERRGISYEPVG